MTKNELIKTSMNVIADLIAGHRIATGGTYEVVWIQDHFVCRQSSCNPNGGRVIARLRYADINEGLRDVLWHIIRTEVRSLVREGVIK